MNILTLQCRGSLLHCAWKQSRNAATLKTVTLGFRRTYATHREDFDFSTTGSRVSQTLDGKQRSEQKHDSVGPFQLGLSQQALRTGQKLPKWSELDTKGKVFRTTARTTNLGVILLGAGLSALLIYSLTSELFSKNSATVIYGDACERIKSSPKIHKHISGPLTFHNNPPSAGRPRHRNRHVTSQVIVDAYGQEHMILSFYVKGRADGDDPFADLSYYERADSWIKDRLAVLPELNLDDTVKWTKDTASELWDKSIRAFKYLSGTPVPTSSAPPTPTPELQDPTKKKASAWDFVGIFAGLKGSTAQSSNSTSSSEDRKFTEGDVHADLIRNKDGYFVFRYLLVDFPSSRDSSAVRVFVERAPGVRENEPVMRWVSHS